MKLSKLKCKLVAKLWLAGLAKNHEILLDNGFISDNEENEITKEIFKIADKLQGEHPKFGDVKDIIHYVKSLK